MPAPIYDPTAPIDPNSPWAQVTPPDDDDCQAVIASDMWLRIDAPAEEVAKYSGMHIAVQGKLIVDGDPDFNVLAKRLETNPAAYPLNRLLFRYIPTEEEAIRYRY